MPVPSGHLVIEMNSPELSAAASCALRQSAAASAPLTPAKKAASWTTGLLVLAAASGIAAGVIPKKEKAWRKAAIGTSVSALAGTAIVFTFFD